ncbi:hypothetical protein [Saccharomonospora xinjiangensis]|uniref:Uncharacterized protein n=1 Tax=Saccharomonospora xinjiangensis XJ-54 TaxID=882086 RepID=I0V1T6_9PSEU|nr:hypothetical protein [Saccharomonospora xinjiangensis]EID54089.1 hypothetical protein SacxiDRAFT_1848 [Saccharomonospora xinjiangensis XJ-54]
MNQMVGSASRYEAADATGSIHIAVNRRALVLSVSITEGWRKKLAPDQFADALLGAYREAFETAVSAAVTPGDSGRPANQAIAKILRDYDDDDAHADWYTGVRAKLDRIRQRRKAIKEYAAEARGGLLDREVRGPNGYLTFQVQRGVLVGVTAAAPALRSASTDLLREDAMTAFRAANLAAEL